ncbi:hypothetical protein Pmani_032382 [Petrolisthes manimaculis]|uniref:Uncharacterized protein n=1 Tax=Petrolisthes manimaculis TaxID=1843537 RepID=A0AAE1TTU6_9EUCA|nr:hypothetical protein Pmani_032382 [Petrolisthes manimaculis]
MKRCGDEEKEDVEVKRCGDEEKEDVEVKRGGDGRYRVEIQAKVGVIRVIGVGGVASMASVNPGSVQSQAIVMNTDSILNTSWFRDSFHNGSVS